MACRLSNCAFTYLLGYITTKGQKGCGISFRSSQSAAEETFMYSVDEIQDDQGIHWQLFDIRHEELFTTHDLYRCISLSNDDKEIPRDLAKKLFYVRTFDGCKKITDLYNKPCSREERSALNAVAKALKASPMKTLRDFQRRQFGTPPTLLGVHYNRGIHRLSSEQSSIESLSSLERQNPPVQDAFVAEVNVQLDVDGLLLGAGAEGGGSQEIIKSHTFKKGELIAFRGTDYYNFNVIELTNQVDPSKIKARSKVKGNILTIYSEEGDVVIFQQEEQEEQWQGGSMLFAHVLRTDNDEIVVLNATRFVTEEGTFFAMEKTAFDEVSLIAEAFEQSIAEEYQKSGVVSSDDDGDDDTDNSSMGEDTTKHSKSDEPLDERAYNDRSSRRTRGNRYHLVMQDLLNN